MAIKYGSRVGFYSTNHVHDTGLYYYDGVIYLRKDQGLLLYIPYDQILSRNIPDFKLVGSCVDSLISIKTPQGDRSLFRSTLGVIQVDRKLFELAIKPVSSIKGILNYKCSVWEDRPYLHIYYGKSEAIIIPCKFTSKILIEELSNRVFNMKEEVDSHECD